jgi:hypothetical protein
MPEKKKREKVVAEITACHLTQLVRGMGRSLSREEAIAFLNQDGRAYDMWKHMMHAGEAYIACMLQGQRQFVSGVTLPRNQAGSRREAQNSAREFVHIA